MFLLQQLIAIAIFTSVTKFKQAIPGKQPIIEQPMLNLASMKTKKCKLPASNVLTIDQGPLN